MYLVLQDYGPPVRIMLFDRCQTEDNETGEVCDISVGKMLSDAKLAVFNLNEDNNSTSSGTDG